MSHPIIEAARREGSGWLPEEGETRFRTRDGSDVAEWLERQGYTVVSSGNDTRWNGKATTACGMNVSTNRYCWIKEFVPHNVADHALSRVMVRLLTL